MSVNHMDDELQDPAPWLLEVIAESTANESEDVRERMRNAGRLALSLARLRAEKERVGFLPLPFGRYVAGLAAMVGLSLEPILGWASLDDVSSLRAQDGPGIGRLASALGFRVDELLLSIRVAVAEQAAGGPLPILAVHRGASGRVTERDCARALQQIELDWPADVRAQADALVSGAESAFHVHASRLA